MLPVGASASHGQDEHNNESDKRRAETQRNQRGPLRSAGSRFAKFGGRLKR
jgi:hypothetical protein